MKGMTMECISWGDAVSLGAWVPWGLQQSRSFKSNSLLWLRKLGYVGMTSSPKKGMAVLADEG